MDNISSDEIDLDDIHQDQDAVTFETYLSDVIMKIRFETLYSCTFFVVLVFITPCPRSILNWRAELFCKTFSCCKNPFILTK